VLIVFSLLLCSADLVILILIEHRVIVFVIEKWDRYSLQGDQRLLKHVGANILANNYVGNVTGTLVASN